MTTSIIWWKISGADLSGPGEMMTTQSDNTTSLKDAAQGNFLGVI